MRTLNDYFLQTRFDDFTTTDESDSAVVPDRGFVKSVFLAKEVTALGTGIIQILVNGVAKGSPVTVLGGTIADTIEFTDDEVPVVAGDRVSFSNDGGASTGAGVALTLATRRA